ncbi:hypothetical protein HanIR_Chr11g0539081 [Helianthus annuus]|nr:hypothetical protein HanIR_Chr11g0539081 [Helianthus annuus]
MLLKLIKKEHMLIHKCGKKDNLCLYGYPNESWEVTLPTESVPPDIPDPTLGINFARDDMDRKDCLFMVAILILSN